MSEARAELLARILESAARDGLADRSLREIAAGAGTSHRMLLHHFGSREGLLAAVVGAMEARQRAAMTALAETAAGPEELMNGVWQAVSSPEARPFVRLFFEVFALATRGAAPVPAGLTASWLDDAGRAAERLGVAPDRVASRLGVAVSRGLLIDLLAGEDPDEVDAAHALFVRLAGEAQQR
ncbi:AcrR family transcriptional regulator [Actinoplanes octamycinicus]|uniref:AcrR family transcriptional regulator n=1 Tax=Actinoplanes octamycinicus TaxID=135948 RepID=A0A7W7H3E2_9ACTN|nr:TetR/AcrR family transcriptional regulator [Actinoplanes octamycinicus]MBB4743261.1 AcrR family transcriptional regulator [Actinoplanes octamycinicus]GIE63848.1 TetR family transcriptional regulator [Actinoplanes octamycinicus]